MIHIPGRVQVVASLKAGPRFDADSQQQVPSSM
jgi:hypothetical protein